MPIPHVDNALAAGRRAAAEIVPALGALAVALALALPTPLKAAEPAPSARRPAEVALVPSVEPLPAPAPGEATAAVTPVPRTAEAPQEIVVEFAGETLTLLSGDQHVEPVVTLSGGALLATRLEAQTGAAPWRLVIEFDPQGERSIDMRAFLRLHSQAVTEAWVYSWNR